MLRKLRQLSHHLAERLALDEEEGSMRRFSRDVAVFVVLLGIPVWIVAAASPKPSPAPSPRPSPAASPRVIGGILPLTLTGIRLVRTNIIEPCPPPAPAKMPILKWLEQHPCLAHINPAERFRGHDVGYRLVTDQTPTSEVIFLHEDEP